MIWKEMLYNRLNLCKHPIFKDNDLFDNTNDDIIIEVNEEEDSLEFD